MIHPNDPALPCLIYDKNGNMVGDCKGLSVRQELAARMKDDFDSLSFALQMFINGRPPLINEDKYSENQLPLSLKEVNTRSTMYLRWLLSGRSKWRTMQADALIEELNKSEQ